MSEYKTSYRQDTEDDDEDSIKMNAMQDAGNLTEPMDATNLGDAMAAGDAAAAGFEFDSISAQFPIDMLAGGICAGFAVQLAAGCLEKYSTTDIDEIRKMVDDTLNDNTLTDAQRKDINDFLRALNQDPELINARK